MSLISDSTRIDAGAYQQSIDEVQSSIQAMLRERRIACVVSIGEEQVFRSCPDLEPAFKMTLREQKVLHHIMAHPNLLTVGEAYLAGDLELDGDIERAMEAIGACITAFPSVALSEPEDEPSRSVQSTLAFGGGGASSDASLERTRQAIEFHYDWPVEFWKLWLDPELQYTCGYFADEQDDIVTAQAKKIDYLCRKLRLQRGHDLLELGCGWGGLLLHAATAYGARCTGVTLSQRQADYARSQAPAHISTDDYRILVTDYRKLPEDVTYDRIVAAGIIEHAGHEIDTYFERAFSLLREGGVFVNQGIVHDANYTDIGGSPFIGRYIFPEAWLVTIAETLRAATAAGFEVLDVEGLRWHYVKTLRHWLHRLQTQERAIREYLDAGHFRAFRAYLAGFARAFVDGDLNLYQVVLSKPKTGVRTTPWTRSYLYR